MRLAELEAILGPPDLVDYMIQSSGVSVDGRQQVNLSTPTRSANQYALWRCELASEQHPPIGTPESIGRYCLALESGNGDWSIRARCSQHEAMLPWSNPESDR